MSDPFAIDFAALRCFRMVHAHGSFSSAAEALGVSQSSVSYTIARLREAFGDPLFVRSGSGIAATERCQEIIAQTDPMVDQFEALAAPRQFDPGSAKLSISLSCNFYEQVTILPALIRMVRSEAPGIRLHVIPSQVQGREQLKRGESDLLIGPLQLQEAGNYRRRLLTDTYVCIMDPHNPLAQQPLTLERYQAAPHVEVNYGGTFRSPYLQALDQQGRTLNSVIDVPTPASLPSILRDTDLIATVPRRIALALWGDLAIVAAPIQTEVSIDLQWTPRTHVSAAHVWLRSKIAQAAAQTALPRPV